MILSRLVRNQMSIERVVAMGGTGEIRVSLSEGSSAGQSVRARAREGSFFFFFFFYLFFFFFFFNIMYSLLRYKKQCGALAMTKTKP